MPRTQRKTFRPPWWLKNAHVQSCLRTVLKPRQHQEVLWEELVLPDGDFIDLCWAGSQEGPLVVLLHGLEGSIQSHYIQYMMRELVDVGWRVVLMHFRSCSGRINRLPQSYHASHTQDLEYLLHQLQQRFPSKPICAVGFSLGGLVLTHHLIRKSDSPVAGAIAVSIPFEMSISAELMPSLYKWNLLRTMKLKSIQKVLMGQDMPVSIEQIRQIKTFREFDNLLTAPLNQFRDADDYYQQSSVRPLLNEVRTTTLMIHAKDDPLIPQQTIPTKRELSPNIEFELCDWGGHVGFLHGSVPWRLDSWFRLHILDFLQKSVS